MLSKVSDSNGWRISQEGYGFSCMARARLCGPRGTVPAAFIQANAAYKFETLAIERSGSQTITEGSFDTGP
jgi:hypothetical protein